jgi:hypothetical protein
MMRRVDLGTGDELGLDILINTLKGLSREQVGLKQICIGGQNEDWPIPEGLASDVRRPCAVPPCHTMHQCTVTTYPLHCD